VFVCPLDDLLEFRNDLNSESENEGYCHDQSDESAETGHKSGYPNETKWEPKNQNKQPSGACFQRGGS
jgi:hypothetical protein